MLNLIIRHHKLLVLLYFRRFCIQNGDHPLRIFSKLTHKFLCQDYRRYSNIGDTQLSASLTQNGAYPLGFNYEIMRMPSRKFSGNNRIGDNQLSAILNYRRYSTIGVTYKRWRILAWTQPWFRQNFSRKFSAH